MSKTTIATAARQLATAGLVYGTAGNISERHGDGLLITASGVRLAAATAEDVVAVSAKKLRSTGPAPSSETGMHQRIYDTTDAGAIVHTHSAATVAVSLITDELPCMHYQQLALGGATPVAPFHIFGSVELAIEVENLIHGRNALLLAHHGAVVTGATLEDAIEKTLLLEWACDIFLRTLNAPNRAVLDRGQQQSVIDAVTRTGYGS